MVSQAPAALALAAVCVAVFVLLRVASRVEFVYGYSYGQALLTCFGLNWHMFARGFFWQPLTYLFLHVEGWHLVLNVLTILLFGSGLERELGRREFWRLFILGGIIGGLGWLGLSALIAQLPLAQWLAAVPLLPVSWLNRTTIAPDEWQTALCIGASGGVFAFIGAFAALFPRREVYILLLVIPVRLRALTLAWGLALFSLLALLLAQSQIAHAAHLMGGVGGYLLGLRLRERVAATNRLNWRW